MSTRISGARNLNLIASSSLGLVGSRLLGDRRKRTIRELIWAAMNARCLNQSRQAEQLGLAIESIAQTPAHKAIGLYYHAYGLYETGDSQTAVPLLLQVIDHSARGYKQRALNDLAEIHRRRGDFDLAKHLSLRASSEAKVDQDGVSFAYAMQRLAICRSLEGDHRGSLQVLDSTYSLVWSLRRVFDHLLYDYLNSIAVELAALGEFDRASRLIEIPLGTCYAPLCPHWAETKQEIREAADTSARVQAAVIVPAKIAISVDVVDSISVLPLKSVPLAYQGCGSTSKASIHARYGPSTRIRPPPNSPIKIRHSGNYTTFSLPGNR